MTPILKIPVCLFDRVCLSTIVSKVSRASQACLGGHFSLDSIVSIARLGRLVILVNLAILVSVVSLTILAIFVSFFTNFTIVSDIAQSCRIEDMYGR